ncbi:IS6 family transposase, partial [Vibrio parahaemolyticus]|nr:IS6 family transposase [Vibrio parahaemolyticus]
MRYFKGKQFKKDIIFVAVGYYCRFSLSYRDVSEILKERGISVHPTTVMRWIHEYNSLIYQVLKRKNITSHHTWHLDETYIKVKGERRYLYRAIDSDGYTLDFQLRKTRNHQATYMFMKRLVKPLKNQRFLPQKDPSLLCAFKKLKKNGFYMRTRHCTIKRFNNLIEQ